MMRTGNPVLNEGAFDRWAQEGGFSSSSVMTVSGAVNKSMVLIGLTASLGLLSYSYLQNNPQLLMPSLIGSAIGGLIASLCVCFWLRSAPVAAPIYALLEGVFLGGITTIFEARFPGIGVQAIAATVGVAAAMLLAYKVGLIRATATFRAGIIAATGGIGLVYLLAFVLSLFNIQAMSFVYDASLLGIGFTAFCVIIAALNLILDFDFIATAASQNLPKNYEWLAAHGLNVTLVWLYLEMLRLLSKLQSRD
ncbi:Bax inhibitor-1/YccA family protein [Planctopirus hydrillae]|nr:Bax inhibitor-1/YccA family protein [Planctopirus hydrillae]